MAAELDKLVSAGTVRLLDVIILAKGPAGEIDAVEIDDLKEVGDLRVAEALLAGLLAEEDVMNLAAARTTWGRRSSGGSHRGRRYGSRRDPWGRAPV